MESKVKYLEHDKRDDDFGVFKKYTISDKKKIIMKRKEQIYKEAHRYSCLNISAYSCEEDIEEAFQEGAEWADANPAWCKYPDEKPKEAHKEYIVLQKYEGKLYTECLEWNGHDFGKWGQIPMYGYDKEFLGLEDVWSDNPWVVAWMELPKPPKFD